MSKTKRAIEDIESLGWNVDNESLARLAALRKKLKKEERYKHINKIRNGKNNILARLVAFYKRLKKEKKM